MQIRIIDRLITWNLSRTVVKTVTIDTEVAEVDTKTEDEAVGGSMVHVMHHM